MNPLKYKLSYRKNLPHIQPPGATLFVTFRLAGSIPAKRQAKLLEMKTRIEETLAKIDDPDEKARLAYREQKRLFGEWDRLLDTLKQGPHWLQRPQVTQAIADSLHYLNNKVYDLDTFCIMSNHVHAIFTPLQNEDGTYHALSAIIHSLKRYTAREANKILNCKGRFWQHESYDHIVRDEDELRRIRQYVLNNPVKVGLVENWIDWPWSDCRWFEYSGESL